MQRDIIQCYRLHW